MQRNDPRALPYFALIMSMFLWASSFVALKIAFRSYDPMVVIFGRMAVASLCFLPFLKGFGKAGLRKKDLPVILVMALCEPGLYFVFEALAMERTTASQAGMMTALLPVMVTVGAILFLKETVTRKTLAGFALAIAGAVWLSAGAVAEEFAPNPALGNFFEFLAMVCATGYMLIAKRMTGRYPPLLITAIQAFVGCAFYAPLLLLPSTTMPTEFEPMPFYAIIYLGVFVTLAAYGLYNYGMSKLPASQASGFVNLIPVIALVMGVALLDEHFTMQQYMAAGMVLAGVFISQNTAGQTSGS